VTQLRGGKEGRKQALPWISVAVATVSVGFAVALVVGSVLVLPRVIVDMDIGPRSKLSAAEVAKARNDVRTTLLQGIGGLLLIAGAVATWRQLALGRAQLRLNQESIEDQLRISEDGQLADRFTRAIDQLASDSDAVRLGGIHSLGGIADQSSRDAPAIYGILATYVRTRSPWPPPRSVDQEASAPAADVPQLRDRAPDIQAAMTVIGHRPRMSDPFGGDSEPSVAEWARRVLLLEQTDLRRALLIGANLQHVHLRGASLQRAELTNADLRSAVLVQADMRGAVLLGADLRGSILDGATLTGASYNQDTKWPAAFDPADAGLSFENS
jgi:hypothetical protein